MPETNKTKLNILSFPSSGKHWMIYIISAILGKDNLLVRNGATMGKSGGNVINITDCHYCWGRDDALINNSDACVLLLRSYKENVTKFSKDLTPKSFHNYLKFDNEKPPSNDTPDQNYMRVLNKYDTFSKPKFIVYYEDLMENPGKTILEFITWLSDNFGIEINQSEIDNFVNNIDNHRKGGLDFHFKSVKNPSDLKSGGQKHFHSLKLSDKSKSEIDEFIKENYPELTEKYLKKFQ